MLDDVGSQAPLPAVADQANDAIVDLSWQTRLENAIDLIAQANRAA